MQVSFVIPLYNCLDHTREALRTLQATLPAGLAHEILLVDDGSTDGTRAWLATLGAPVRVLLNERNLGFAGACNRGAAAAGGEVLFFVNNDLVFPRGWFEPMLAAIRATPTAGLVGNVQLDATTGRVDHTGLYFTRQGKPAHETRRPWLARLVGSRPVPALTGACFAVTRALWGELGGFDEGYRNGAEDVDLCLRAAAAGRTNWVVLRSVVRHHVSQSPGRKQHDEANTRRLVTRWRDEIVRLALRDSSRALVEEVWAHPHPRDAGLALRCLAHAWGLRADAPPESRVRLEAAMAAELRRWDELLGR